MAPWGSRDRFPPVPRTGMVVLLLAFVLSIVGCTLASGRGQIRSEAGAVAAARRLTEMAAPVEVVGHVQRGRAGDIYTGVYGSCVDEAQCQENAARRKRVAWRVDLTGFMPGNCDLPTCPLVRWNQQLIIDEATGDVLYRLASEGPLPQS